MKKMNKKGFTIVELVIVIAVIAILAAVLIPTFAGITKKANKSATLQEARNVYTEVYANDLEDDGVINGTAVIDKAAAKGTYSYSTKEGAVESFSYKARNYTAALDITTGEWTVTP